MSASVVRCMVADLGKRETVCLNWERQNLWDGLGTYAVFQNELKEVWEEDSGGIALATGPLTGMPFPGAGGMSWCRKKEGRFLVEHTEGRLGAMLRYAGVDHLIIKGESREPVNLFVDDGRLSFLQAVDDGDGDTWPKLLKDRPDTDSVVCLMDRDGVREDSCFLTGSRELSDMLQRKGIRAMIVSGGGSLEIEEPQEALELCLSLCQAFRTEGGCAGGRMQPARYLSANHIRSLEDESLCPRMPLAFLGLGWDETFPGDGQAEAGVRLLSACTGIVMDKAALKELGIQIERGMQTYDGETV